MSLILRSSPESAAQLTSLLARPILALGQPSFGPALLGVVGDAFRADLLSAFSLDEVGRPHYRFATAVTELGNAFAERAGVRYESDYWSSDPGLGGLVRAQRETPGTVVSQQAWSHIPPTWYRAVCYEQPQLVDRVSVLADVAGRRLLLSAYRRAVHGPFSDEEIRGFAANADILVALVGKHVEMADEPGRNPGAQEDSLDERLAARFPALSTRERQVCAGIVGGLSAKEIARTYGIEPSSVVTYKKRALDKIEVPNGHALVALWHASGRRSPPA
ncbi:hypothetical protein GmRootV59_53350 (plasmid) [Variovorax sp. V59]|uniref:helix-turn-helix transcriptional regulator n=1 Tax=unclassified Variovorax TaxID=663243 RepID=UPI0034E8D442